MANIKTDVFRYYDMSGDDDACWHWHGPVGGRARALRPYFQFENKRMIAYRAVYELVHGVTLTTDQLLAHSCDNGNMPVGCGNPKHLALSNNSENMDDMKLRQRHGLPHHVVRRMRKLYAQGRTQQEIGELYGVNQGIVSALLSGKLYGHVINEQEEQDNE